MSGRRLALVVTVDRYENPGLRALAAPAADAQALADVLGSEELGGFELEFLHNPTSWTTNERVDGLLADRQPSDLVLLHFSCHGLKDVGGELYLAATNTVPDRLASTAVDSAWINRVMHRSRAQRVVLLLDCCYGGAFERGVLARAGGGIDVGDQFRPDHLGESRGRVVITASTAMEYAFEGSQLNDGTPAAPSVFTGALVEGIRTGRADRDQDGFIGLDELYDYVYEQVRLNTPQQTPCKWEFGLRGELYVARNPNRRAAPILLPQDLLDLIDHPTPGARLAAVDELNRLATGLNLARAAAARQALVQLADDDSRRVAASAADAVRDTAVHLPESTLDLGVLPLGASRLEGEMQVEGPPLALASSVTTTHERLQARVEAGALRISWAATPGRLDEMVTLSGLAGEARLRVTAGPVNDQGAALNLHNVVDPVAQPLFLGAPSQGEQIGRLVPLVRRVLGRLPIRRRTVWLIVVLLCTAPLIGVGIRSASKTHLQSHASATPAVLRGGGGAEPARASLPSSVARPVVMASLTVGREPQGIAVSPDSQTVYVANQGSRTLSIIDATTRTVRRSLPLAHTPRYVAVSPDGATVYVSMYESDTSGSGVAVIAAKSAKVLATVATGPSPFTLAVAPEGLVWVPIHSGRRVEVIDGRRLKIVAVVAVPESPHEVALSDDGKRAYTPDHESNMVSVIDTQKKMVIADIGVGKSPHSLTVAPGGRTVLVANYDGSTVSKVDTVTRRVTGPFPVGNDPQSIAFSADGVRAYVVNESDNSVSTLAAATGKVTSTLQMGRSPRMIAVAPDGRYAYVTNGESNTVTVLRVSG